MKQIPIYKGRSFKIKFYKNMLIDDEDFDFINKFPLYTRGLKGNEYVVTYIDKKVIVVHRLIMLRNIPEIPQGYVIDHINGDTFDNQRNNLRLATVSQNTINAKRYSTNSSGYKGVYYSKEMKVWYAQINLKGARVHLDYFNTKEEAALAYNRAVTLHFGEFAKLNVIQKVEEKQIAR